MAAQPQQETLLNKAIQHHQNGELREAETLYRQVIKAESDNAEALYWLGTLGHQTGKHQLALPLLQRAIELNPDDWRFHNNISVIYRNLGDFSRAIAHSRKASQLAPQEFEPLINLGQLYGTIDQLDQSIINLSRALTLVPMHEEARLNLWGSYKRLLPDWFYSVLNNKKRNKSYEKAIKKYVNKNSCVLEIGLGGALFAMMAAKQGAKEIKTCVSSACIAQKTAEVLDDNGLKDHITLIQKPLVSLAQDKELYPEKADVFILDIFDPGLLGQGILPVVTYARQHLLKENAVMLPQAARVEAMLFESSDIKAIAQTDQISGFDMSKLSIFKKRPMITIDLHHQNYKDLTDKEPVFNFDFEKDTFKMETQEIQFKITNNGQCDGVAYWFCLNFGDKNRYDNNPLLTQASHQPHWMHCVQLFDNPINVKKGDVMKLRATQRSKYIWFELV